jgi:hypothetical protein
MLYRFFIRIRLVFTFLIILNVTNLFCQVNGNLKHLLDSLKLDYNLTPNIILNRNNIIINKDIIWAGKIDTIDFKSSENKIEFFFYCNHRYFDNVSNENILTRNVLLKRNGDGDFVLSIISNDMTIEDAKKVVSKFAGSSTNYIMTIGKPVDAITKYGKNYVAIMTYYFYTFK